MSLSLREVLELELVRRTRPELLHGQHLLDRPVRWVHTSELAEAAYLLKGGELLLTTGQGLFGRGAVGEAAFVGALAERGVTALALELGWTYSAAPEAMVAAAREHDLPLLVLHEIIPFVEITEQVQTALLESRAASAHRDRTLRERLTDALLDGAGPAELIDVLAAHLDAPVVLTAGDGSLGAAARREDGGRPARSVYRRDVLLLDRIWGRIAVYPPARAQDPAVRAAGEAGAEVLSLALLRSATAEDLAARRRKLIEDLVEGRTTEQTGRAAIVLGPPFTADAACAALLVRGAEPDVLPFVVNAVEHALAPVAALVGALGTDVVVIAATTGAEELGATVLAAVDGVPGAARARVVVGPVVGGLAEVRRSVADARRAMDLAVGLRMPDRCLSAGALTAQILLGEIAGQPHARRLVHDEIGPLLDHDHRLGTHLVETLRVYLAHGSNKVNTADALHIRRQTLYQRLARIGQLIGDVRVPRRHTGLVVALAVAALGPGEAYQDGAPTLIASGG
jgi:purine catabolism regulator